LRIAVVITPVIAEAASGVASPAASSVPPAVSVAPASRACTFAGRIPSDSIMPSVPARPGPPNQPKSFCVPWPMNSPPMTSRAPRRPTLMSFSPLVQRVG
jgi:hypothetical protein